MFKLLLDDRMATITTNEDREDNAAQAARTAGDAPPTAHQAMLTPYLVWVMSVGLFHEEDAEALRGSPGVGRGGGDEQ